MPKRKRPEKTSVRELDLILFDLDGTLIDSKKDIADSANYTLKFLGLPELHPEKIYSFIGDGVRKLLERTLPPDHLRDIESAWTTFSDHYQANLLRTTVLFPGVTEVLTHFQGKSKIIVTNKPERFAIPVLEGLGVLSCFERIIGGESMPLKKPHPDAILTLLQEKKIRSDRTLMIGDGTNDIEAGKRAGVIICAVSYGLTDPGTLLESHPDLMIDDLRELIPLFR